MTGVRGDEGGERPIGPGKGSSHPGHYGDPLEGIRRACLGTRRGEMKKRGVVRNEYNFLCMLHTRNFILKCGKTQVCVCAEEYSEGCVQQ